MDDRDLLLDYARRHSSAAFTTLVERHIDLVHSAALRRVGGDHHRAADVTQTVFTDLARKAEKVATHPVIAGWLHQSTRWAAATLRRADRRRATHEQAAAAELHVTGSGEPTPDWAALRPLLDRALDDLRPDDRDAVLLRFFSNLSYAEIGKRLGIAENTARMRVDRALDRLQTLLRKRGVTSTAAALGTVLSVQAVSAAPAGLAASVASGALAAGAAATAATGTTVATLLMSKLQIALVVALAAVLATALHRASRERDIERQELAAAQHQQASLQQQLQTAKRTLEAREAEQQAQLAAAAAAEQQITPVQRERARLDLIIRRGELDQTYAPLFRYLKLDPATLDQVKTLLVERNQAAYDAQQAAKAEHLELSFAEERELQTAAARTIDPQLAALLGPDKMAVFTRYVDTLPIRQRVLPQSLSDDPAREADADALISLFQQTAPTYLDDCAAAGQGLPFPDRFLTPAKSYLTPVEQEQLAARSQMNAVAGKMAVIARAAAYAGKLKLTRSSAALYASTPAAPAAAASTETRSAP